MMSTSHHYVILRCTQDDMPGRCSARSREAIKEGRRYVARVPLVTAYPALTLSGKPAIYALKGQRHPAICHHNGHKAGASKHGGHDKAMLTPQSCHDPFVSICHERDKYNCTGEILSRSISPAYPGIGTPVWPAAC